jgi:hypothetical protein
MSLSGVACYDKELKYLACLLRALPKPSHLDLDDSDLEATIPLRRDGVDIANLRTVPIRSPAFRIGPAWPSTLVTMAHGVGGK